MFRLTGFTLRTLPSNELAPRLAVSISEKANKRATERNRMRRQIYGFVRAHLSELRTAQHYHVSVYKEAFSLNQRERREAIKNLFTRSNMLSS
jgi:ribonuclease P protein component